MLDYCGAAQRLRMPVAKIRGVDEIESAGSGFSLASKRPKILFEGHLFYAEMRRKGLHLKAQLIDPTICYPTWTKAHYIGRDGEYARLAKATEICHALGVSDALALRSTSWGRYQILGSNFIASGFDTVEEMVEAMFLDEDNHLEAFCEYIVNTGIDDELRRGDIVGFVRRYNGPLYARNNYHIKLPRAIERFEKQKVNCREIEGQVVAAMPGLRDPNPGAEGFANTGFDERYLKSFDAADENTGLVPNPFKEYQAQQQESATANANDGASGPAAVETTTNNQSDPQEALQSLPTTNQAVVTQSQTTSEDGTKQVDTSVQAPAGETSGILDHVNSLGDRFQGLQGTLDKFGISNPLANTSFGTWFVTLFKYAFSAVMTALGVMYNNPEYLAIGVLILIIGALVYNQSRKRVAAERAGVPVELLEKVIDNNK